MENRLPEDRDRSILPWWALTRMEREEESGMCRGDNTILNLIAKELLNYRKRGSIPLVSELVSKLCLFLPQDVP